MLVLAKKLARSPLETTLGVSCLLVTTIATICSIVIVPTLTQQLAFGAIAIASSILTYHIDTI